MSETITVGLDLAKNVFQVHGADVAGRAVLRKKLHWRQPGQAGVARAVGCQKDDGLRLTQKQP